MNKISLFSGKKVYLNLSVFMSISDLISLISIMLAIVAFLSDFDRNYIKNKFTPLNYAFLIFIFLYLNFLLYFKYWLSVFPFLKNLNCSNCPKPATWAYIIALLTIVWILLKIFYFNFPSKNYPKLKSFYKSLLINSKYDRLSLLINKYHIKGILNYLKFPKKENSFNEFLFTEIISCKDFIYHMENYDFDLLLQLLKNTDKNNKQHKKFIIKFINVEINKPESVINKVNKEKQPELLQTFIEILHSIKYKEYFKEINLNSVNSDKLYIDYHYTKKALKNNIEINLSKHLNILAKSVFKNKRNHIIEEHLLYHHKLLEIVKSEAEKFLIFLLNNMFLLQLLKKNSFNETYKTELDTFIQLLVEIYKENNKYELETIEKNIINFFSENNEIKREVIKDLYKSSLLKKHEKIYHNIILKIADY